jgi:hypothetical protein
MSKKWSDNPDIPPERYAQLVKQEIVAKELGEAVRDYVYFAIDKDGQHPLDALSNASAIVDYYLTARL